MKEDRIHYLLQQYVNKASSQQEFNELMELAKDPEYKGLIEQFMDEQYDSALLMKSDADVDWEMMYHKVIASKPGNVYEISTGRSIKMWRWVAAAAIVVMIVGGWWMIERKSEVGSRKSEIAKVNDVAAPKDTRAVITLADGTKLYLDSAGNGLLAKQDNVSVVKNENGEIEYRGQKSEVGSEMKYNMAYNPRGSKVLPLTLNDGTKVWLNAESSLKYPTAFNGNTRDVEITGEAYFEVAHDASKPFHVKKGSTDITVLGTHFNVKAYNDEDVLKVTLLEGSVRVSAADKSVTIRPGEQAQISESNAIGLAINPDVNVNQVVAWKNGKFDFGEKTDLYTIMKQVARWYDVDVEFKGSVSQYIGGSISMNANISDVLKVLEASSGVKFKIEGKKVTVTP